MARPKSTIILTGANGGLGSAIVSQIASLELTRHHGLYTVRNTMAAPNLSSALEAARSTHPHSSDALALDLTNLTNIREVAATINRRVQTGEIPPIRALTLNAGWQEY
ncbi:hypothetical protein F4819DRAFT_453046 [Hypoxylon fuscum]|nr:hypothetical protein F4819DRAFT_453046 [Hypoxylon fuscum]